MDVVLPFGKGEVLPSSISEERNGHKGFIDIRTQTSHLEQLSLKVIGYIWLLINVNVKR